MDEELISTEESRMILKRERAFEKSMEAKVQGW